jgi:CheY-like chemotaxis protein
MGNKHILIVDDDKDLAMALKAVLESAGYRTTWAANGTEAWEKAQQLHPDAAIVDVIMDTTVAGVRLTHRFRADEKLKGMPILMLTGIKQKLGLDIRPQTEEGLLYLPVDRFMEKPVDPKALLQAVAELV